MEKTNILKHWNGSNCVLATMHGKENVIAPPLKSGLGLEVNVPANFDTDVFGTFTRDIKRDGTQLEAARRKALSAMEVTGLDIGVASEGTFGDHPSIPFIKSNYEIVILIDKKNDIEVVGHYSTINVQARWQDVYSVKECVEVATSWGFPGQGVILRLSKKSNRFIYKEINTIEELKFTSEKLLSKYFVRSIFIETDMRAHRCPPRRESIKNATSDLIKNCKSLCPKCLSPGFVISDIVKGLKCRSCGLSTDLAKENIYSCKKCDYIENRKIEDKNLVDPEYCKWCNP